MAILIKVLVVHLLRKWRSVLVHWHLIFLHLQGIILLWLSMHRLLILHLILLWHHVVLMTTHVLLLVVLVSDLLLLHGLLRHHLRHAAVHLLRPHYWLRHLETLIHLALLLERLEILWHHSWSITLLALVRSLTSFTIHRLETYKY